MIAQGRVGAARIRSPAARPRAHRLGRRWRILLAAIAVLAALLCGAWLWFRDSSLVAVTRVNVTGESGSDAAAIRAALTSSARSMTTLDVSAAELRTAVAPYPVVRGIRVTTQFPHGMRIRVLEEIPVGNVLVGARRIAVAGDGTLLRDVSAPAWLPTIPLAVPPGGIRVSDPQASNEVTLLAAAPRRLLAAVSQVSTLPAHGLVAELRNGPRVYFGSADQLAAKWIALSAVLADPGSQGADYIDVTDPQRPAAGAGSDQSSATTTPTGSSSNTAGGD